MGAVSDRKAGLLIDWLRRKAGRTTDAALVIAFAVTLASGLYIAYAFVGQLRAVGEILPSTPGFRFAHEINRIALWAFVSLMVLRIALLLIEPGRLVKQLSLRVVGPILVGMLASTTLFGTLSGQLSKIDAEAVPNAVSSAEQTLRELIFGYRREAFAFVPPLVEELSEQLAQGSLGGAGFLLETAVDDFGLVNAGIIDSNGRYLAAAPDSSKAGLLPEPQLRPYVLAELTKEEREDSATDAVAHIWFLPDESDAAEQGSQIVRAVRPLGEIAAAGGADPPLLLIESRMPAALTHEIAAMTEEHKRLNTQAANRTGLFQLFFQLTMNAAAITLYVAVALAFYAVRLHGRRLRELARTMDEVAYGGSLTVVLPPADPGGDEISAVTASFSEMTHKLSELTEQLTGSLRFFENVLEHIDAGVIVLDVAGRVSMANSRCSKLLGDLPVKGELLAAVAERQPQAAELAARAESLKPDEPAAIDLAGRSMLVSTTDLPPSAGGGRIIVFADISDPLAEQRLAAWSEALQRFLHEVKNPLQPLLLAAEQLQDKLAPQLPDEQASYLRGKTAAIIQGIARIDRVTNALRAFTSQRPPEYAPIDVNRSVREAVVRHGGERVRVSLDLQADAPALFDDDCLARALDNLLVNAREAAEGRGRESVSVNIATWCERSRACLAVQDDAGGIKPEELPQVFRPHISFKSDGSGLGLAHVKGMIAAAGGSIEAANRSDGACFTLTLPLAQPA